jgi:two-component system sensor histidine kinase/response regulator
MLPVTDNTHMPRKVLVIDDNAENRELAKAALEEEGFVVELAHSGEVGLERFVTFEPDCVVLDVRMPVLDGFATCKRLRTLEGGAQTPVLFLTALRDVDTFDGALAAGGDDFLTKPVRPSELVARVRTQIELRRFQGELRNLYDVVKHQRDDLLRLQLQKERLSSFLVHDLKTPVAAIDLQAQLLLRDKGLSADSIHGVHAIRAQSRQLVRLIVNLLDIAKAEEGRLEARLAQVDVDALIERVRSHHTVSAERSSVDLFQVVAADSKTASLDADLIERTLENLVENALRHTPARGTVTISARRIEREFEFRVSDTGPGVSPALRERIFDRYVQSEVPASSLSRAGRGLGLAFCRAAIEAHGGRIFVADTDEGAVFCMRIPDVS